MTSETDTYTITLGIPGKNDRLLTDLRALSRQRRLSLEEAHALVMGFGMAELASRGIFHRGQEPMSRAEMLRELRDMVAEAEEHGL